jgi:hypothetical protein
MAYGETVIWVLGILVLGAALGGAGLLGWRLGSAKTCMVSACELTQSDVVLQLHQANQVISAYVLKTYAKNNALKPADLRAWMARASTCFVAPQYQSIALLRECTKPDCKLLRCRDGHGFRDLLEKQLSDYLCQLMKSYNGAVTYVSLGSGGLFQDFCILQKVLACYPQGEVSLILIDLGYWWYVGMREKTGMGPVFSAPYTLDDDAVQRYVQGYQRKPNDSREEGFKDLPDAEFRRAMQGVIIHQHEVATQFCTGLAQRFPLARVRVYVYDHALAYQADVQAGRAPKALFIGSVDASETRDDLCSLVADRFRAGEHIANLLLHYSKEKDFGIDFTRLIPAGGAVPTGYVQTGKTADYTVCCKQFDFSTNGNGEALFADEWRQRSW